MSWSEPLLAVWPPTHGGLRVQESGGAHRPCSEPQSGPHAGRGRHRRTGMSAGRPAACWGPRLQGTWGVCRVPWGVGGRGPGASEAVGGGPGDSALDREGSPCLGGRWGLVWGDGRDPCFPWDDLGGGDCPFFSLPRAWRWSPGCGRVLARGPRGRVCGVVRGSPGPQWLRPSRSTAGARAFHWGLVPGTPKPV